MRQKPWFCTAFPNNTEKRKSLSFYGGLTFAGTVILVPFLVWHAMFSSVSELGAVVPYWVNITMDNALIVLLAIAFITITRTMPNLFWPTGAYCLVLVQSIFVMETQNLLGFRLEKVDSLSAKISFEANYFIASAVVAFYVVLGVTLISNIKMLKLTMEYKKALKENASSSTTANANDVENGTATAPSESTKPTKSALTGQAMSGDKPVVVIPFAASPFVNGGPPAAAPVSLYSTNTGTTPSAPATSTL